MGGYGRYPLHRGYFGTKSGGHACDIERLSSLRERCVGFRGASRFGRGVERQCGVRTGGSSLGRGYGLRHTRSFNRRYLAVRATLSIFTYGVGAVLHLVGTGGWKGSEVRMACCGCRLRRYVRDCVEPYFSRFRVSRTSVGISRADLG